MPQAGHSASIQGVYANEKQLTCMFNNDMLEICIDYSFKIHAVLTEIVC